MELTRRLKSGARIPSLATLKKYGLTEGRWLGMLAGQEGVCPICKRVPPSGRFATDHEHVKGWRKMPPHLRRAYVRGIPCVWCNRWFLHYGLTLERARNVVTYLERYEDRRDAWLESANAHPAASATEAA